MTIPRGSSSGDYECLHEVTHRPVKPGFRRKTWLVRGIGLSLLLGLFLATSLTIGRKDNLHKVLIWIHEHRAAGFFIFGLLYVWFTVLFLPPALLAACAGAIYGFLMAIPLVWVCAVFGETVSFLLGRFLLKKWVAELTADWPMWTALNAALSEDGWKLVALLRVSPVVPFSVINYALGSSSLPFSHYFWPSAIGIMPGLIIYVWLGSLASDVSAAISEGGATAPPAAKIVIIVVCAVSALLVVVLSAVYTKRAIDRRLAHVHVHEEVQVEEQHYLLGGGQDASHRGLVVSVERPVVLADGSGSSRGAELGPAEGFRASDGSSGFKGWVSTLGWRGWSWQKSKTSASRERLSSDGDAGYLSASEDGRVVNEHRDPEAHHISINGIGGSDRSESQGSGHLAAAGSGSLFGVLRGQQRKAPKSDLHHLH